VVCNAANYDDLSAKLVTLRPDAIIHLAAVAHAGRSDANPHECLKNGFRTLENTIDVCRHIGVERLVYFSSSTVYGDWPRLNPTHAKRERDTCHPRGAYAVSKLLGELWLRDAADRAGFDYTIIRPSAVYGERCISRRVVQILIEQALSGQPMTVGPDLLDFTYVFDLVKGVAKTLERPEARKQTFNITSGEARPIEDVAKIIQEEIDVPIKHIPPNPNLPRRGTLEITRAETDLGYKPSYSLEAGVGKYLRWTRENWQR
jgi:nucleoside-diphosphate-sugar epimerase